MPYQMDMHSYPLGVNLDFLFMKFIAFFTSDYAVVMNSFYILTFYLTAVASMAVFRHFKIEIPLSILGAVAYTFLYYHFARIAHFNLIGYYMIPLVIMVMLWISGGNLSFLKPAENIFRCLPEINKKGVIAFFICLLASTNTYYAFFSVLLIAFAGLFVLAKTRDLRLFVSAGITAVIMTGGIILNQLPSIIYSYENGISSALIRGPAEAELWGMKIIQLLLPAKNHIIQDFSIFTHVYSITRPLVNENMTATLGLFASAGFVILICVVLFRNCKNPQKFQHKYNEILVDLSVLNLSAVLIGTIGGFGAIIACLFPAIHLYNRISVFIAFFSVFAVLIVLQILQNQYKNKNGFHVVFLIVIMLAGCVVVLDQVPAGITDQSGWKDKFYADEKYIGEIESTLPENSMIFQLPCGLFPHGRYESIKPYLHSESLRWSYPVMYGSKAQIWQQETANMPVDLMIKRLREAGFKGILIDKNAYPVNENSVVQDLKRSILHPTDLKQVSLQRYL